MYELFWRGVDISHIAYSASLAGLVTMHGLYAELEAGPSGPSSSFGASSTAALSSLSACRALPGRVCIVNNEGAVPMDKFVRRKDRIIDFRTYSSQWVH